MSAINDLVNEYDLCVRKLSFIEKIIQRFHAWLNQSGTQSPYLCDTQHYTAWPRQKDLSDIAALSLSNYTI